MSETSTIETLRMEAAELRQTVQFLKESMAKAEAFIQTARRHPAEHELPKAADYPAMKTIWTPFGDVVTLEDARLAIAAEKMSNARLISSSPDMIEAIEMFESWWRLPNDARTIQSIEPAMRKALDAIKRAKGGI